MASPAWFLIRVYTSHPCSARRRGFSQAESPHSRTLSPLRMGERAGVRGIRYPFVPAGYRFPRMACSRSMASNNALKLPLPKPREPLRWIISKKSVGRSCTVLVKVCSR
jgi:hypothetical protein